MAQGFSLKMFMPSGEPQGLRLVEKTNWTGQGIAFPRDRFLEADARDELRRTGVYILWERDEVLPQVYIGEADDVSNRLRDHMKSKQFWTDAVAFVSKDNALNKAHVQYLESQLIQKARAGKQCNLLNANTPSGPSISEADEVDGAWFLYDLLQCLAPLGLRVFEVPSRDDPSTEAESTLYLKARGVEATGQSTVKGFVVFKDSQAHKTPVPAVLKDRSYRGYVNYRQTLIDDGVLKDDGETYRFAEDHPFSSPSRATFCVIARSPMPYSNWKDASGRTLGQIQADLKDDPQ